MKHIVLTTMAMILSVATIDTAAQPAGSDESDLKRTVAQIAELYNRKHPEGPHMVVVGAASRQTLWATSNDPDELLKILQRVNTLVVSKSADRITVRLVVEPTGPR